MSRHVSRSEIDIDRYDDRRTSYAPRDGGGRRYVDRSTEEDISFRRGNGPVPTRERDVSVVERRSENRGPDFLREDYGRTSAGPLVLRGREREEFEFAPRPRRRSPSPEPPKQEREEIIIRRDERSESRGPPLRRERSTSREREEIIIRRDERESLPRGPPPRGGRSNSQEREEIIIRRDERDTRGPASRVGRSDSREREEIIIRRDERDSRPSLFVPPRRERESSHEREEIIIRRDERDQRASLAPSRAPPAHETSREREEIIIRRDDHDTRSRYDDDMISHRSFRPQPPPARHDHEREEIIIRRDEREDDRQSRYSTRRFEDDFALDRPISHERARSAVRSGSNASNEEIIIRRDEREGRGGDRDRQEIIIRRSSRSRSRSPSPAQSIRTSRTTAVRQEPPIVYAPQIHQEVITHHRHIDHGYEVTAPRPISRPPSPPSPPRPAPRERSQERIEIRRTETKNGRTESEDIVINRDDGARSVPPPERERDRYGPPARRQPSPLPPGRRPDWEERSVAEEAQYYNNVALERGYPGEAYHGSTRDWGLVDIPPGTRRVRMDGAGGGRQEISWQRYNGSRRSKFDPDGASGMGYESEIGRPGPIGLPEPEPANTIGPRYGKQRDPRDGLWTEVTKDLVIKEAIMEMGYEYQETDEFFYIFKYMSYVSDNVSASFVFELTNQCYRKTCRDSLGFPKISRKIDSSVSKKFSGKTARRQLLRSRHQETD